MQMNVNLLMNLENLRVRAKTREDKIKFLNYNYKKLLEGYKKNLKDTEKDLKMIKTQIEDDTFIDIRKGLQKDEKNLLRQVQEIKECIDTMELELGIKTEEEVKEEDGLSDSDEEALMKKYEADNEGKRARNNQGNPSKGYLEWKKEFLSD